ncbi:tail length tape measure protein [Mycobacterium phage Hawkeye]|uniref:Tapemeasure n=1 Tax=Mycobacterium phage Hawkeye TaxID=1458711 RepID=X2KT09_9CAUD|nr:tail length tape measure protein [Mycobacterium phage Hawkeye]AHN84040.1 tape measure protein [Mycobacterium phage Hawkeye]
MPDYNLGRAHGKIVIETDNRGIRRAEGAMDDIGESAQRVAEGFDEAEKSANKWERTTRRAYGTTQKEAESLDKLNKLTKEASKATDARKKAEAELRDILKDNKASEEDIERAINKANRAKGEALRIANARKAAERELAKIMAGVPEKKTTKIDLDTKDAHKEITRLRRAFDDIDTHGAKVLGNLGKIGGRTGGAAIKGGVGLTGLAALGGLGGLAGAGGVQGVFALAGAIADMSGALGVLPGIAGAAAVAVGTVELATNRFGEALKSLGTDDLAEKIKDMAPAAQYVAVELNTLLPVFKNFQKNAEQAFFEPLQGVATRLTQTFMPTVQGAVNQVANIIGSTGAGLADWLMKPEQQRDIQAFLQNVVEGLSNASQAAQPLLQAFTDIMKVSSDFLPQIGNDLAGFAREIADFIRTMRENGELESWIRDGIASFKEFLGGIKNFGLGLVYIGRVANQFGSGFISIFKRVSDEFLAWVQSVEGQNSLTQFFMAMSQATQALLPLLSKLGDLLVGTVFTGLAKLGTALAPGISFLLETLNVAFHDLFQSLIDSAPSINGFLTAFGIILGDIIQYIGPTLPNFLKSLADLLYTLGRAIGPAGAGIVTGLTNIINAFNTGFNGIIETVKTLGDKLRMGFETGDYGPFIQSLIDLFKPVGDAIMNFIINAIRNNKEALVAVGTEVFNALKDAILGDIEANAKGWGEKIVRDLVSGIVGSIPIIGPAAKKLMEALGEWFPSSPAKKGPFSGSGWTKYRGEALMEGFADGMLAGGDTASKAANNALGMASGGMDSGIKQFVDDMTEFTGFGRRMLDFIKGIGDIVFETIKLATTDFKTGKSTIPARWVRTVSDEELARQKADKEYRKGLSEGTGPAGNLPDDLKRLLDTTNPTSSSAPGVPGAVKAPGALGPNPSKQSIADYIINKALSEGYSRDQANQILIQAVGESGLDPKVSGGVQGVDEVIGIFQEMTDFSGGLSREERMDAQKNIDAYFKQMAAHGGPKAFTDPAKFLGIDVSIGGPWHPDNQAKGHLTQAQKAAQQYIDAYGGPTPAIADLPKEFAQAVTGVQMKDLGNGFFKDAKTGDVLRQVGNEFYNVQDIAVGPDGKPLLGTNGKPLAMPGRGAKPAAGVPGATRGTRTPYGLPHGTDTGGYGTGSSKVFPAWVMQLADAFGVKPSTYSGHQETNRGEAGYAPNPQNLNRGIDWSGPVENMQRLADYLSTIAPELEQVIFRNPKTGKVTSIAGGKPVSGYYPEGTLAEHENHVHTRQSMSLSLPNGQVVDVPTTTTPGIGSAAFPGSDPEILQQLQQINSNTASSALTDDKMLGEFLSQNPLLSDLITTAKDPNATDEQVANSLSGIQSAIDAQNAMDTPASRYLAEQLTSTQNQIAQDRGFGQAQNPVDAAAGIANGAVGLVGDVFKIIDGTLKSIESASNISSTLVRGIENTEDIMSIIDNVQSFIELAATIAQTVTDGLNFASSIASAAGSAGGPFAGGATGGLQAAAAISGIITSVISSVNAAIDLGQEAYRIGSKYFGKFLSYLVGAGEGSLLGDIKFLLDKNDWTLKAWSEDNPEDKRSREVPAWLRDQGSVQEQGGKIRDLNMYIGPGTDPNEAMNEGMWRVMTDQGGVFTSEF